MYYIVTQINMNTTFSIRIDDKLKKSFLATTKERWLDGAVLLRYFMEKVTKSPNIIQFDIEDNIFDDLFKQKTVVKKLEKISDKLDTIWF